MQSTSSIWQQPVEGVSEENCRFYHAFDFPDGSSVKGDWDLRGRAEDYLGKVVVTGKRVLDLGAASGFMSFEMEKMGANVVSADVASAVQYTKVPYYDEPESKLAGAEAGLKRMKNSYWFAREKYSAQTSVYHGDLFNLPSQIGRFDIGFIGQILIHNRDPIGLIQAVAELTDDILIIAEGMHNDSKPFATIVPTLELEGKFRPHGWFRFSTGALNQLLNCMGFDVIHSQVMEYKCCIRQTSTPITTIVSKRRIL